MRLLLALVSAALAASLDAPLAQIETLARQQLNKPADEARALDRQIFALGPAIKAAGPAAAAPLEALARDEKKLPKTRVWAVNFLALLEDPAAFRPLSSLALDTKLPELVRAQAMSGLATTGVSHQALRRPVCAALAQKDLPAHELAEALLLASKTGCDDPKILARRAKDQGSSPAKDPPARLAKLAIEALAVSQKADAARELLALHGFYKPRAPQRGLTLSALLAQRENLKLLRAQAVSFACATLGEEADAPDNALAALKLIVDLNAKECAKPLLRALKNPDAEVVAADAEALADLGINEAKPRLSDLLDKAISDERFAPRPGKPEPRALLARIERALIRLR